MSRVRVESLAKTYSDSRPVVAALGGVSLDVSDGTCVTILGPSGCGKTTLLRIVAGLERPDFGTVRFDAHDVTRLPPQRRNVGFVRTGELSGGERQRAGVSVESFAFV